MILGLLILLSYAIVAINTRAIAKAAYIQAMVSGTLFMSVNFMLVRYIVEATTVKEFLWYLLGGCLGDAIGIYISLKLDKPVRAERDSC